MLLMILMFIAVAVFSMGMPRHYHCVLKRRCDSYQLGILKLAGSALLFVHLLFSVNTYGLGIGITVFFGQATLVCFVIAMTYTFVFGMGNHAARKS